MSDILQPVLVIAYKYPPYAGVGSFRWAKLSKYLARLGHRVHVLTIPWEGRGRHIAAGPTEPGIDVHRIPSGGPHRIRHRPISNRWLAAARGLAIVRLDRTAYWDDEAQRWGAHVLPAAQRLISEHGVRVVVTTGHPFQANRWAAELKRARPELRLIQDFRDPWADNPFRSLPPDRAAQVRDWQREAVAAADAVVAVTEPLLDLYTAGGGCARAQTIANGVDPEDVRPSVHRSRPPDDGRLRLTHIGNVSNGRDEPLDALLEAVAAIEPGRVVVELVGGGLELVRRRHSVLVDSGALTLHPPVTQPEALRRAGAADYALQLNARAFPYLVSTKIYEYAQLGVPALSLNYGGEVDRLVRRHGFGHSVDLSSQPDLLELLHALRSQAAADRDGRFAFDVEPFTHSVLAHQYSTLIQSL